MTRQEKLAALRQAGYAIVRSGELGVLVAPGTFLPWAKVGPFLGARKVRRVRSMKAVADTLGLLAARQPEPWEERRRQYLEEVGRTEHRTYEI